MEINKLGVGALLAILMGGLGALAGEVAKISQPDVSNENPKRPTSGATHS